VQRYLLILLFLLSGNYPALSQGEDTIPVVPDTTRVSMLAFYNDTLHNDSFFKSNYAIYALPKVQVPPDSEYLANYRPPLSFKQGARGYWTAGVVLGIALMLLVIKFTFTRLFQNSFASFYRRSAIAEIIYDRYSPRWLFALMANLFFVLVIALWLWAYLDYMRPGAFVFEEKVQLFLEILAALLVIYVVKFLVHLIAGSLIQAMDAVLAYLLNISITHLVCGIIMFFVTLLILYSPWRGEALFNTSIVIIGIFILIRYLKNFIQTLQFFRYNYLYLILYLCALEISPWFLVIKYINNHL
jgi:hypothetical protein